MSIWTPGLSCADGGCDEEEKKAAWDAAEAEHIFEPYVKLNQFFDGQGVGLTVARNIARRLGGDVVFDTTKDTPGTRFVLSLPI